MNTGEVSDSLAMVFSELVYGTSETSAFVLNRGDVGLLKGLDRLSASDASRAVNGGATIAAHAQHLRYGLSLMNRWAAEGGDPFSDATWDAAWTTGSVDETAWAAIRSGLAGEVDRWLQMLQTPREANPTELAGMISSIAHLAYHLGAVRQIDKSLRGPREGTF